jgi:hypothetical protein
MAGYMTRFNGRVYDFEHVSKEETLPNGVFVEIDTDGGVKLTAAAKDTKMKVVEKTTLWGTPAVILDVDSVGEDAVYFVENEWEVYEDAGEYNTAEYAVKKGHYVRMKRPLVGERLIMTVDST